jgi:hypothetical protein
MFAGSLQQAFDFLMEDKRGREVWSRLHGGDIDLSGLIVRVQPGDSVGASRRKTATT